MLKIQDLKRIETKDEKGRELGELIPLWKEYEIEFDPKYVYYTTILPGEKKGPYQHTKRRGLFCVVSGKLIFIYKEKSEFKRIEIDADNGPKMIDIPKDTKYLLKCIGDEKCSIINICDYSWKEGDNETIKPDFSGCEV